MKKAIIVAHNSRFIVQFELRNIKLLQRLGYEVHCATDFENEESILDAKKQIEATGVILHQLDIERFRFHPRIVAKNIVACKQLKRILREGFDVVHCHTPIGGVVARIAAMEERKKGTKVIYTAHGFHFFKGAPILNWLLYYPIEWLLAHITDVLITINQEDYARAGKFKAKKVCYVPGVGVDFERMNRARPDARIALRNEFCIPEKARVVLSVGEVNENKNHRTVINAIAQLADKNIWYVICGRGPLVEELRKLAADLGVAEKIIFAGYRTDVADFYRMADLFAFMSYREGLSVALMEAMACGLPCVASRIRGNTDLIVDGVNGVLVDNEDRLIKNIKLLETKTEWRNSLSAHAKESIQEFGIEKVMLIMKNIYEKV